MLNSKQTARVSTTLKVVQLICFALITGVLLATLIFAGITDWQDVNTGMDPLVLIGVFIAMVIMVMAFMLPGIIGNAAATEARNTSKKRSDRRLAKLATAFQTKTIIQFALLESAALLNLILFFMEKSIISLALVAVLVALMLLALPRATSMEDWIAERLD